MKRLSYPSYNLHENEEKQLLPPFMDYPDATMASRLDTAAKFGEVVRGLRKPGHHIPGPTKNPSCPCDHCRNFFEAKMMMGSKVAESDDREKNEGQELEANSGIGRARALSLGQMDGSGRGGGPGRVWRRQNNNLNNCISSDKSNNL